MMSECPKCGHARTDSGFCFHCAEANGKQIKPTKYMMATKAYHLLGDISSDVPDLCWVSSETDTDYYGAWVTGMGFAHVKFPKATTRELTSEEVEKYNKLSVRIGSQPAIPINIPCPELVVGVDAICAELAKMEAPVITTESDFYDTNE